MEFSHRLKRAFIPNSVAVVGASDRKGSRGTLIWNGVMNSHRILQAYPVNPKYKYIGLTPCWAELSELPEKVDLVVIATPTAKVQSILRQCAELGIPNVLITPGDDSLTADRLWRRKIVAFCAEHSIRLIGPDSSGIIRPQIGLNVSYWPVLPKIGHVGLICQSSSVTSAVLDRESRSAFGFSSVLTAGIESDVTLAEMLNFLSSDPATHVIAIHVETLIHPRKFFSALRAASRIKPVIVLKTGCGDNSARLIASRFACPVCEDAAFDALLKRGGAIRCDKIEDFCATIELFTADKDVMAGRLASVSNGLGFSSLCAASAQNFRIRLANPSEDSANALSRLTGLETRPINPVDLGFEADSTTLARATETLLADKHVDSVLLALSPTAALDLAALASALEPVLCNAFKPVFLSWAGAELPANVRSSFARLRIPVLPSIDSAMMAFSHLIEFKQLHALSLKPPTPGSEGAKYNFDAMRDIIEDARQQKRNRLTPEQCEHLLNAIGITCAKGMLVTTPADAVAVAKSLNSPVALKICAEGLEQRTRIGGIILDSKDIAGDFDRLKRICAQYAPLASFTGILVQKMSGRPNARELKLSLRRDPVLGPVISVSAGGKIGELFPQKQVALPPLTEPQAQALVEHCVVYSALDHFRGQPKVDLNALVQAILKLSKLVCEIPAITELDINPLIVDELGVLALDATAGFSQGSLFPDPTFSHMLIAPAPNFSCSIKDSSLKIRSIRADDFEPLKELAGRTSEKSLFLRLQKHLNDISDEEFVQFTQLDYDREHAYAVVDSDHVGAKIHGVVRFVLNPFTKTAEFGLLIEDAFQRKGIGTTLMEIACTEAKKLGVSVLFGFVLVENEPMKGLMKKLGFIQELVKDNNDIRLFKKNL